MIVWHEWRVHSWARLFAPWPATGWCASRPGSGPAFPASRLPRSGSADAPAPEEPRDQQHDDGADDRAQDPRRVQREERHGVEEHQVLQEAPDEGADDPEAHGPEQAHRVPAGYHQPGDGPRDQAHNEQGDNELQHTRKDTLIPDMLPRAGHGAYGLWEAARVRCRFGVAHSGALRCSRWPRRLAA